MILTEKLENPVLKLLRSENFEFIISFLYHIFRNKNNQNDTIKQIKLEKELELFIKDFNGKTSFQNKKEENAHFYIEFWIKNQFLRRIEIWDFENDYTIELSDSALQVLNFVDNLWIEEKYLHASVKSDFENALWNLKFVAFSSSSLKEQNVKEIEKQIKDLEHKKKLIESWTLESFEEEVYDKYVAAKEILKKLPTSFRKVETVFENIYLDINKKSNNEELNRGKLLSFTLDEIEQKINSSPQWKSFEWFEQFYSKKPKELIQALEEVFSKFEIISELEKQKSIRSLIEVDLLKSKKRAYAKKTFIVSKLRDVFNESSSKERKIGISLIKNIKKLFLENNKKIQYKEVLCEINDGIKIDVFMGKNFFESKKTLTLQKYELNFEKQNIELNIENIFRYTTISENEVRKRIFEFLTEKETVKLQEILENHPIKYWIDEFMLYIKSAKNMKWSITDSKKQEFEIVWIKNDLVLKSGEVEFVKK